MSKVSTILKGNMLFETQIRNHRVQIDVPPSMGDQDRGPTPPEFFVASLGSCVAGRCPVHETVCSLNSVDIALNGRS